MPKSDPSIHLLPDHTINQIAAGEVIENPASVVKELVENSIDSGAEKVVVEIIGGGFHSIKVSDDGCGLGKENLPMAFVRHATSKIGQIRDMDELASMGFRGEALASIGSVAKVKLTSKSQFSDTSGYQIECFGGKVSPVKASARAVGTTLIVESLFYNVPARRSFQKSSSAATRDIVKLVTKLMLAHPFCGMKLICDGAVKLEASCPPTKDTAEAIKLRIEEVMGHEEVDKMIPIDVKGADKRVIGFLGTPSSSRKTRLGQYLFINNRPVVSPVISSAIYDAFGTRLTQGEHPTFILHISLPSVLQDVNVHPQKKEIRLKSKTSLYSWLLRSIENAFGRFESVSSPVISDEVAPEPAPISVPEFSSPSVSDWQAESFSSFVQQVPTAVMEQAKKVEPTLMEKVELPINLLGRYKGWAFIEKSSLPSDFFPPYWDRQAEVEAMAIFDLKRASLRVEFDKLVGSLAKGQTSSQALLLPKTVTYAPYEVEVIEKHREGLKQLGIELRPFGPQSFAIEALPMQIGESEVESLVVELATAFEANLGSEEAKRRERLALLMLRHMKEPPVRGLDVEVRYLFQALRKTSAPYYCPRGQAIFGLIGESKFEKLLS